MLGFVNSNQPAVTSARLIVCEKTGRWARTLLGSINASRFELCQTRSLPESRERLRVAPFSVVAVECDFERVPRVCDWLQQAAREFPQARAIVLADQPLGAAECVLRSAGAHHVVCSPHRLPALLRWLLRHMDQVPRPTLSARQWAWQRMPWPPRHGSTPTE